MATAQHNLERHAEAILDAAITDYLQHRRGLTQTVSQVSAYLTPEAIEARCAARGLGAFEVRHLIEEEG